MVEAYRKAGGQDVFADSDIAHVVLERDRVMGANTVEGLEVDIEKQKPGMVAVRINVLAGAIIEKPVHMCFGVLPEKGKQFIDMDVEIGEKASVEVKADCVFPNAISVEHRMEASVLVKEGASFIYRESHFHGEGGGVEVKARSRIDLDKASTFKTYFDLQKGRAGSVEFDYASELQEYATLEMVARMQGREDDRIRIKEAADLTGRGARALLESRLALQDRARGEVLNELNAAAPDSRGHVECTEIIKNEASARAVPIVDVQHPSAKVTHEAAIGSVDSGQLQTLMSRGLDEEEAADTIIQGMLNG